MKKQFLILMRICFVAALIISCNKSDNQIGGKDRNITWKISDEGVLTISGKGHMWDYDEDRDDNGERINAPPWAVHLYSVTAIVIEEGITRISNWAFAYCHGFIENLTLPKSLKFIGDYAFFDSFGINGNLILPEGLISIGNEAFQGCSGFTGSLILPEGLNFIGHHAFAGCRGFTGSLTFPKNINWICEGTFSGCSGFNGSLILEGLRDISDYAFNGCSGFTGNLIIPKGLGLGNCVFGGCRGFSSLTLIGDIGVPHEAFSYCTGLIDIINYSIEPQTHVGSCFIEVPISNITLHVPSISLEKYRNDDFWGSFGNIVTIENSNNNN